MLTELPATNVYTTEPINVGTDPALLRQQYRTPNHLFFARNHGDIPTVNPVTYRLTVDGLVRKPLCLSLADLRDYFPSRTETITLNCAGNRRKELDRVKPISGEVMWDAGGISTAVWRGVPLRDVLLEAGVTISDGHAAFTGLDRVEKQGRVFGFGGSIALQKALSEGVLLAYEMNGEPLPVMHGFPLRAVVPGYIGARSVKWLSSITVQREPSQNFFQTHAYKLFPPDVSAETVQWEQGVTLSELLVNSVICHPVDHDVLEAGRVQLEGFALAGGDARIETVEVSADGGRTWQQAALEMEPRSWVWCFWKAQFDLAPGRYDLVVRAVDSAGNRQPERLADVWNFKGYLNNAWHRVSVTVV